MSEYLGEKQQGEDIRLHFTLTAVPDGLPGTKPQVLIEKQGVSILAAADMVQGADSLDWYYDYTVDAAATIGAYQVKYTAVVDGITFPDYDTYDVQLYSTDDLYAVSGAPAGPASIIFNVQDTEVAPSPLAGVIVSVHNANNDDSPHFGVRETDAVGNTPVMNLADTTSYKIRLYQPGIIDSAVKTVAVSGSGTENLTVDLISISAPAAPSASTVFISVYDLSGNVVTSGVTLTITPHNTLTKDAGNNYITSTGIDMVYDAGSETWQAPIIQGEHCKITSTKVMGVDDNGALISRDFTVGSGSTTDLGAIRLQ